MDRGRMEGLGGREPAHEEEFEFEVVTVNLRGEIIARQIHRARQVTQDLGQGMRLELVAVPAGTFRMGSPPGQGYADEHPQHSVRLPAFLISKYPITQEQWAAVMDWTPPYRCQGARRPADRVSWNAAREFCRRLSSQTGRTYRLPSEAEWEYACRAGTASAFHFGPTLTTDLANYVGEHTFGLEPKGLYRHETTPVGSFPPNAFGLYDMHGDVWEWCSDAWHTDYAGAPADGSAWERGGTSQRVLRGGGWHDPPDLCRSAARLKFEPGEAEDFVGFRVVLPAGQID
jgi:formylglycine-generating enzyme required for sulfatase activity